MGSIRLPDPEFLVSNAWRTIAPPDPSPKTLLRSYSLPTEEFGNVNVRGGLQLPKPKARVKVGLLYHFFHLDASEAATIVQGWSSQISAHPFTTFVLLNNEKYFQRNERLYKLPKEKA